MKRAGAEALAALDGLLAQLRALPALTERKPGIFYRGAAAFLHFHEDPAGLFADAKTGGAAFERWPVGTTAQQQLLLRAVRASLTGTASRAQER